MSYCRWSSDDFHCDLYCYEHVDGGWTTHVAGNRVVGNVPSVKGVFDAEPFDAKRAADMWKAQIDFLKTAERRPIGLRFDGATFQDATLEEFKQRLLSLRSEGYNFPDHVLLLIEEEKKGERLEG